MSDLNQRIRNYLDRKKPAKAQSVTLDVKVETEPEVKPDQKSTTLGFIIMIIVGVFMLWQAYQVGEVQNQCYLSKECREWVENR